MSNVEKEKVSAMTVVHNFIFPSLIAAASAYMGVNLTIATITVDLQYLKRDLTAQGIILEQVREHNTELRARGVWMVNIEKHLQGHGTNINSLEKRVIKLEFEQ